MWSTLVIKLFILINFNQFAIIMCSFILSNLFKSRPFIYTISLLTKSIYTIYLIVRYSGFSYLKLL